METKEKTDKKSDSTDKRPESVVRNALKVAMPLVVPWIVKEVISLIPENSKWDDILKVVHEKWEKFLPAISGIVLQITKNPEWVDDVISELNAEVIRALKERYTGEKKPSAKSATKTADNESVLMIASTLAEAEMKKFFELAFGLSDEKQKVDFLNLLIPVKTGKAVVSSWAKMESAQFQIIVSTLVPISEPPKPKEPSKIEKQIKQGLTEFQEDADTFLGKKTWLEQLAEQVKK